VALKTRDLDIALLLTRSTEPIKEEEMSGFLQIDRPAQNDHWDVVKLLIEARKDIDFRSALGAALFHEAIARGPTMSLNYSSKEALK